MAMNTCPNRLLGRHGDRICGQPLMDPTGVTYHGCARCWARLHGYCWRCGIGVIPPVRKDGKRNHGMYCPECRAARQRIVRAAVKARSIETERIKRQTPEGRAKELARKAYYYAYDQARRGRACAQN